MKGSKKGNWMLLASNWGTKSKSITEADVSKLTPLHRSRYVCCRMEAESTLCRANRCSYQYPQRASDVLTVPQAERLLRRALCQVSWPSSATKLFSNVNQARYECQTAC